MYSLKPVPPSDFAQVARLEQMLHADAWGLDTLDNLPTTLAGFGVLGAYDEKDNGRLLGYLIYQALDVSELLRLGVDKAYQGQGIGARLAKAWLDGIDTPTALLEVRADNTPAIALYHKLGFKQIHVRKGYYKDKAGVVDGLILECQI